MSEKKNLFQKFSAFMDQNIRGVQYGIYSIAGLGVIIALRSVRPFAKFNIPSDIPPHFIIKKMPFTGKVLRVEPSQFNTGNPLVMVNHQPLIALKKEKNLQGLPLEVSSINITMNGFVWLQSLLTNEEITFVPLRTDPDRVHSIILRNKQNVGEHLVKIGFATVSPIDLALEKDQYYLKYYKILLSAEKKAENKGLGIWAGSKISFLKVLLNKFKTLLSFST